MFNLSAPERFLGAISKTKLTRVSPPGQCRNGRVGSTDNGGVGGALCYWARETRCPGLADVGTSSEGTTHILGKLKGSSKAEAGAGGL